MNIELSTQILAASGDALEWVIPVLFFAVWIIGGIAKVIAATRENNKQRAKQSPGESRNYRYKPIPEGSKGDLLAGKNRRQTLESRQNKRQGLAKESHSGGKGLGKIAAIKDAYAEQAKRESPKPTPARRKRTKSPRRSQAAKTKPSPKTKMRQVPKIYVPEPNEDDTPQEGTILAALKEKQQIRNAIIYSEVLGKPKATRDDFATY